ncbi:MAG: hypothetical protein IT174_16045 [Acidobacteria bacterium]|nr:hypothetical protein [Acidobacteriota bacterium]
MKRTLTLIIITIFAATFAFADIARPEKPKPTSKPATVDTQLTIDLDKNAKEARLIIPRSQLKQLRAELDSLDTGRDDTASALGITRIQTILGGAFLSLAFVFAGFAVIKRGNLGSTGGKAAAGVAILFAGGVFATIAVGNAGPPSEARSITGKMFTRAVHLYGFGSGKIKLEVSDEARNPKLIVPNPPEAKPEGEE